MLYKNSYVSNSYLFTIAAFFTTPQAESREKMRDHLDESLKLHLILQKKHTENLEMKIAELAKTNSNQEQQIKQLSRQHSQERKKIEAQLNTVETTQKDFAIKLKKKQGEFESDSQSQENFELSKNLSDLDLRFQLHENSTFDGMLLWKINNYNKRKYDAEIGSITALHSSPCFTSRYGYKYCLRLYLNGDGLGRGEYLSLFLVIMKSEYDNVLQWPFQQKVKFTIINQVDRNRDISERMVPDKNSSSFQKPVKDMNIASGCPKFMKIDRLGAEGFLKDDSLFIEVNITQWWGTGSFKRRGCLHENFNIFHRIYIR